MRTARRTVIFVCLLIVIAGMFIMFLPGDCGNTAISEITTCKSLSYGPGHSTFQGYLGLGLTVGGLVAALMGAIIFRPDRG